jgi:hypothetical protein
LFNEAKQDNMRLDTLPAQSRLFGRHQPFPRALKPQLNPESRGEKYVDFTGLNFLEVSGGNFGFFSQLLLRHASAHPLPAHIRAEKPYSRPFFFAQRHDILHRRSRKIMNDMVHRENIVILLVKKSRVVKTLLFPRKLWGQWNNKCGAAWSRLV